jgi:ABC-2 type transport system ATP-binding protein
MVDITVSGGEGMEVALEAHGIGKRYRRRRPWALRDVDFAIPAGSITALVGPNCAGKSTLIKGFVAFERPTAGRLFVQGIDPWRHHGAAIRLVGYVPQAASLYRELTVSDHLALAGAYRPSFDRPHAELRLDELDIPLDARADELSGGQQAQVGLAIALGTRAPVLLLDEPLASLDPLARREFLHVLAAAVRADGSTALLSSHVITDIEQACDRLLVLGGGRKLLDVSIAEARATHRVVDADGEEGPQAPAGGGVVGRFPGPLGEPLALVTGGEGPGRPATLEEVVLGHLAAGRKPRRVNQARGAEAAA